MATTPKPSTADGYDKALTLSCERVLVTLLNAFGTLKPTLRLIGGLVPRYLTPENAPHVPAHAGTSDVDIVINVVLISQGETYASLANQMKARGFERNTNGQGHRSGWRWERKVSEHEIVLVEFLCGTTDTARAGGVITVDGESISALQIPFADIVHDWFAEKEIQAELLDGRGIVRETIRFADLTSFVVLKALAFDGRKENKDAGDLIHVLRYAGSPEDVAKKIKERIASGLHADAIDAAFKALDRCFCDNNGDGHRLAGPVAYARFIHGDDPDLADERVLLQRDASYLVTNILEKIRELTPAAAV